MMACPGSDDILYNFYQDLVGFVQKLYQLLFVDHLEHPRKDENLTRGQDEGVSHLIKVTRFLSAISPRSW